MWLLILPRWPVCSDKVRYVALRDFRAQALTSDPIPQKMLTRGSQMAVSCGTGVTSGWGIKKIFMWDGVLIAIVNYHT